MILSISYLITIHISHNIYKVIPMHEYHIVKKSKEYIPDPYEDIIEDAPPSTKPIIITDTTGDRQASLLRFYQIMWFVFGTIETVLLFRFAFKMIGANTLSGFTDLIYMVSAPFVAPFVEIVPSAISGASVIEWSTLIAMAVFLVLAYGVFELIHVLYPLTLNRKPPRRYISRRTRYAI